MDTPRRVVQTLNLLCDEALSEDQQITTINNLIVLARERAGAALIIQEKGIEKIYHKTNSAKSVKIYLPLIRAISEICKHEASFAIKVLRKFSVEFFLLLMVDQLTSEEGVNAVQYLMQAIINSLTGFDPKQNKAPSKEKISAHKDVIDDILIAIAKRTSSRAMCANGRDALLEIISRNVGQNALNKGDLLLESDCLGNLLDVASEVDDLKHESSMCITRNTKSLTAIALERMHETMDSDKLRSSFREQCMDYIKDKLRCGDAENRIKGVTVLTTLLQGPADVGNFCLSQQGIVEMMLLMAKADDDEIQQKVAVEAIIAAASKKEKCSSIASMGTGVLKDLYKSPNEAIKVRALVGLCKIGSAGGADASFRPIPDESIHKLAGACKKILINTSSDHDKKRWASEGLAYLTLHAEVKEGLIDDKEAMKELIALARTGDLSFLYGVVTIFVNLTNSHDKKEIIPELVELAKFAKQHVPKEHPKDSKEFIDRRIKILASMDIASALVSLCKTESISSREMISRIFSALCEQPELRGKVVAQGGVKALLQLFTTSNTERGKVIAAQALARIGITMDPTICFTGQRSIEVVRPLMRLLDVECSALENFESLMALTNLAQVDESTQKAIIKNGGLSKIEHYLYDEHPMLKRASTQCIANLITNSEVVKIFEEDNDRVKYWLYLCGEDDRDTMVAAAGGLAMLTGVSGKCCQKIFSAKDWEEILLVMSSATDRDIQHRALFIIKNIIFNGKSSAEKIIETKIFNVLMAITLPHVDDIDSQLKQIAKDILQKCQSYDIIKPAEI